MTAPTPGPGWQELGPDDVLPDDVEVLTWDPPLTGGAPRRWVLTPPRPLPTAVGTVIRIPDGPRAGTWTLDTNGWTSPGTPAALYTDDLQADAASFTTVSEPRAVTAAAVLADVRAAPNSSNVDLTPIAVAYGVALPTDPA